MNEGIALTKFRTPRLRGDTVARASLLAQYRQAQDQRRRIELGRYIDQIRTARGRLRCL